MEAMEAMAAMAAMAMAMARARARGETLQPSIFEYTNIYYLYYCLIIFYILLYLCIHFLRELIFIYRAWN